MLGASSWRNMLAGKEQTLSHDADACIPEVIPEVIPMTPHAEARQNSVERKRPRVAPEEQQDPWQAAERMDDESSSLQSWQEPHFRLNGDLVDLKLQVEMLAQAMKPMVSWFAAQSAHSGPLAPPQQLPLQQQGVSAPMPSQPSVAQLLMNASKVAVPGEGELGMEGSSDNVEGSAVQDAPAADHE